MNGIYEIVSLGCAKNLVDSEAFAFIFESMGWEEYFGVGNPDILLVNTCAFLQDARDELAEYLEDLQEQMDEGHKRRVWVTGCITRRGLQEFQARFPFVEAWIDLKDFEGLRKLLGKVARAGKAIGKSADKQGFYPRRSLEAPSVAYLRISDGCSNHCSYCTIPFIRGEIKSVPIETLVEEARALAMDPNRGAKELVVIAQDTCCYGVDIYGRQALPELLTELHKIEEFRWIRVMYMHPDHFQTQWLELWQKLPRLLPYFEIPIQHCDDAILKAMGRKKGEQELRKLFADIREAIPEAVLRTTLIVGFPGETDEQFEKLRDFVEDMEFNHLGVFCYSQEAGTPAGGYDKQVKKSIAVRRMQEIMDLQAEITERFLESYVGQTLDVLIDYAFSDDDEHYSEGRSWFLAPDVDPLLTIENAELTEGEFARVEIIDCDFMTLVGESVKQS